MVVAPIAIDLFVILACLGALMLILCAKGIAQALATIIHHSVGHLPIVGRFFGTAADWIEKQIVSAMSDIANGVEGVIGAFWHALGNLVASIGHEIYGLAVAIDSFGQYLHNVVRPWVVLTLVGGLQHGVKWLRHEIASIKTTVYRTATIIEHPVHTKIGGAVREITRPIAGELGRLEHWVFPRVKGLEHELDVTIPRDIAAVRSRVGQLDRFYERLWAKVRHLDKITVGTLVGALALTFLAKLGAGWILCRNWKTLGRGVCRLPGHFIEDLLGLIADFVVLTNICQVLPWLEEGFSLVVSPLVSTLSRAGAGVCHSSSGPPAPLTTPALYLPAAGGTPTLHLP